MIKSHFLSTMMCHLIYTKIIKSKCASDSDIYFSDIFNVKLTDFLTALNAEKS